MRAWQVQDKGEPIEVLHLINIDPPQPGPGQIRIHVTAGGLQASGRAHVPSYLPAHAAAALHPRTRGVGGGHVDRRRVLTHGSATGSWP